MKIQPFTNNLLLYNQQIHILWDRHPLATIETNIHFFSAKRLCCLPNSDICATAGYNCQMQIFDSKGRFLLIYLNDSPQDFCYLDRWKAPSSSASSLFLIIGSNKPSISVRDVNDLEHLLNLYLYFSTTWCVYRSQRTCVC